MVGEPRKAGRVTGATPNHSKAKTPGHSSRLWLTSMLSPYINAVAVRAPCSTINAVENGISAANMRNAMLSHTRVGSYRSITS